MVLVKRCYLYKRLNMETNLKQKIKEDIIKIKDLITSLEEFFVFNNFYEIKINEIYKFSFYPLNPLEYREGLDYQMVFSKKIMKLNMLFL